MVLTYIFLIIIEIITKRTIGVPSCSSPCVLPENVKITNTKIIAGTDVKNEFRDVKKYVDEHGGNESDYCKVAGKIESAKYIFDIHFVKDKAGNEYDFKIKSKTLKRVKDDR